MRLHSSCTILACQQMSPIYAVFDDTDASKFLLSSAPCWSGCSTVAVNGPASWPSFPYSIRVFVTLADN
jgi:hypothetical protein